MTQPLHYTPKAIDALLNYPCPGAPGTQQGMSYLAGKLREAQVFVLPDHGELLDRSKLRPQVPGLLFRPAFPVVALEYTAVRATGASGGRYYAAACTKRIALAWDWQDDLPPMLAMMCRRDMGPGVVVASIAYYDEPGMWMPVTGAMHIAYEDAWGTGDEARAAHVDAAFAAGKLTKAQLEAPPLRALPIPLLPEPIFAAGKVHGFAAAIDSIQSDVADEVAAYTDLCYALACKNVATRELSAPKNLNRNRLKAGKLPLKGFHVWSLTAAARCPGQAAWAARVRRPGRTSGEAISAASPLIASPG